NIELIDIMIINTDTSSSIMYGCAPVEPSSDLSIEITVDQQFPMVGSPLVFTIIVRNNGNINVTGVMIRFELPLGLMFSSYTATSGLYDNSTSIWRDLDTIRPGESAFLNVTALVGQVVSSESIQFLILLDGSGSIQKKDLNLIRNGFVSAVGNSSVFPRNGLGELTVVEFGGNAGSVCTKVVLPPTVISNETIASVLTTLNATTTMPGLASTACGFLLGSDTVTASSFFKSSNRHVVLLITDGKASLICNIDGDYSPDPPSGANALASAIQARDYLIGEFGMDYMSDEIDVIAVHVTDASSYKWFKDDMVWPQPGYYAPPFRKELPPQGFVSNASDWDQFPAVFKKVLATTLNRIEVLGSIVQISVTDPKIVNNIDGVIIIPQII
ncbi:MAG TPA: VWA domain-containing protein, partial [Candidatus Thermoplasmatota archaeon]|nr:VWA domain-containing protein [Candidatus Thermoplasmatota archaeon]